MHPSDPSALEALGSGSGKARGNRYLFTDALVAAIGNTPLVDLSGLIRPPALFSLWGKAEFLNPSGSVKDRAALGIVRSALEAGRLADGRTLIDASSGNTAVAYAMLGARLGFRVAACLPRTAHPARIRRLRALGAEVIFTDPTEGTDGAQREARRRAEERPQHYYYPDQYNNPANPEAHYRTTGPEIWSQSSGRVTDLVAGVGTGGTITGIARFLREKQPSLRVTGVEPDGPIHGIEGLKHLPSALRPSTYDAHQVDQTLRISTEVAEEMRERLAAREGLIIGRSAGAAVAASLEVGRSHPGSVVVTILPDASDEPLGRIGGP